MPRYVPTNWVEKVTVLGPVNLNHIEQGIADAATREELIAERDDLLAELAQHSVHIWGLEATVLAMREDMAGWQGEGWFLNNDEVLSRDAVVRIKRGVKQDDGYAEGLLGSAWSAGPTKLTIPAVGFQTSDVCWSPDGTYLMLMGGYTGSAPSPLRVFKRNEDSFTDITTLAGTALPGGTTLYKATWSQRQDLGKDLVVFCYYQSNAAVVYKRNGDLFELVNGLNIGVAMGAESAAFDPTGMYLVVSHYANASNRYMRFYKRSGETVTLLSGDLGANDPASVMYDMCWSGDGVYLFGAGPAGSLFVFKRTGDTLAKIATLPITAGWRVACNSDGTHIVVTGNGTAVQVFQRTGDNVAAVAGKIDNLGEDTSRGVSFSPDDKWLVVSSGTHFYTYAYDKATFTFTFVEKFAATAPTIRDIAHDPTMGLYLATAAYGSPYAEVWRANPSAANVPAGKITLKTKALPEVCNAIYILDKFVQTDGSGVTRSYEVSLDGGTTWETISGNQVGDLVKLGHTGDQLSIRVVFSHPIGDNSKARLSWVIAFATYTEV